MKKEIRSEINIKSLYIIFASLITLFFIFLNPINAKADMGPKESVEIQIINYGDSPCYAILFSGYNSHIHQVAWPNEEVVPNFEEYELDSKIREIFELTKDNLGPNPGQTKVSSYVYYLSDDSNVISFGYMLPDNYFVVLYYPETDTILRSGCYSNYAFNSYYTVDASTLDEEGLLVLTHSDNEYIKHQLIRPNYMFAIILRLVLTVGIELALALAFRIKGKKSVLTIIITNIATQIALNICLIIETYKYGTGILYLFEFFIIEIFIFLIEAAVYSIVLRRTNNPPVKVGKAFLYSLAANSITFMIGMIPTILTMC